MQPRFEKSVIIIHRLNPTCIRGWVHILIDSVATQSNTNSNKKMPKEQKSFNASVFSFSYFRHLLSSPKGIPSLGSMLNLPATVWAPLVLSGEELSKFSYIHILSEMEIILGCKKFEFGVYRYFKYMLNKTLSQIPFD